MTDSHIVDIDRHDASLGKKNHVGSDENSPLLQDGRPLNVPSVSDDPSAIFQAYATSHHANLRLAFIRRVYGILTCQLLLNVAIAALCMYNKSMRSFCIGWPRLMVWGTFIPAIVCLLSLFLLKNKFPWNGLILFAFTCFESLAIGSICAMAQASGIGAIVLHAFGITCAVFVLLTAFTMLSKIDFSFLGTFLSIGLTVMIGWGLLSMIFGFNQGWLYSWLGALLFCGYILFDTYLIMEKYEYDDYILAAIDLYLDFLNLFLYILQILAQSEKR